MTEHPQDEPVRWLSDPSVDPLLRADLAHGSGAVAQGVDYASTLVALRAAIGATAATAAPGATAVGTSNGVAAATGGGALALKVGIAVVALAGAAAWWVGRGEPKAPEPTVEAPASVVARAAAPEEEPAGPSTVAPTVAPPAERNREVAAQPNPTPTAEVAPISNPTREDERTEPTVRPKKPESDEDRFLREAKLVAAARKQLGDDPAAALASTKKLGREFPRGALVEETKAIEVAALVALGRVDEARRKGSEFLGAFGDGPHAAAVRRALGDL